MTGGGKKVDPPKPAPPAQVEVANTETTGGTTKKKRRGYLSTILSSSLNERNDTSILKTDKLG